MRKKKPIVLKTAIIVDFMGHGFGEFTREDEIVELTDQYSKLLAPAKLDIYTPHSAYISEMKEGTDLVLFDYGGLLPGTSLAEDNSRRIVEWAENHPSCLVVVTSTHTWRSYVKYELSMKDIAGLFNLVHIWDYVDDEGKEPDGHPIPQWFRDMHKLPYIDPYAEEIRKVS
jgi:hypothetical protein